MGIGRKIKKGVANPRFSLIFIGELLNRAAHTRMGTRSRNPTTNGNILDKDWDNLIILDACRYDYLSEYSDILPGELKKRHSPAAKTKNFIRETFTNRHETDLVYITAVPWWGKLAGRINSKVHKFVNLESHDIQDPELDVELPEDVAHTAIEIANRYPDKRIIVHFNQSHYPFIGRTGRTIFPRKSRTRIKEDVVKSRATVEQVREAYKENLELVLPEALRLHREFDGKTVITADHGEMLGERSRPFPIRDYGHTAGIYTKELIEVPWLECEFDSRKRIADSEASDSEVDTDAVNQRLENLGYI